MGLGLGLGIAAHLAAAPHPCGVEEDVLLAVALERLVDDVRR